MLRRKWMPNLNQKATTFAEAVVDTWIPRWRQTVVFNSVHQLGCAWGWELITLPHTAYQLHQQIKDSWGACLAGLQRPDHLPWALLGLCTALKEDSAGLVLWVLLGLLCIQHQVKAVVDVVQPHPVPVIDLCIGHGGRSCQPPVCIRRSGVVPPLAFLYETNSKVQETREILPASARRQEGVSLRVQVTASPGVRFGHYFWGLLSLSMFTFWNQYKNSWLFNGLDDLFKKKIPP